MPVTADALYAKSEIRSPAMPAVGKRRCLVWGARRGTDSLSKEAVQNVSSRASDKENEAEIIQRASAGDRIAFEYLYRAHYKRVYAICLRMIGNATDAEDMTQEAFMRLFRKIHTFRGESAFSTWLHRLVVNLVLMHLRKKSLPAVSMEVRPGPEGESAPQSIDVATSDLFLEGSIDRINLQRCIAQLPMGCRAIFVLHDIQGYQHHEIAEMLGRSEGVSKSQLHRARKRLRGSLHEIQREKYHDERQAAQKTLCHDAG